MYYSDQELQKLSKYKGGTTVDRSLIYQYLISPTCFQIARWLPSWLAPNVITFIGLVCNIASYALIVKYAPNMSGEAPPWVYATMSLLIFLYMMLDNTDGKQAVRTGSSSPLGEIFDHGVDSMSIAMGIISTATVLQTGPRHALYYCAPGFIAFYLAHWQEYFNHFLDLGYFGPTEAECFAIALFLFTSFFGTSIWSTSLDIGPYTMPLREWALYAIVVLTTLVSLQSIFEGLRLARRNGISPFTALSQLIPFTVTYTCFALWVYFSPNTYEAHPHLFLTLANMMFSYLTIHCIVQRMCDLPYRWFYWPMLPFLFAAFNSYVGQLTGKPLVNEEQLLVCYWGVYMMLLIHFVTDLILGFCRALKISCWTIPYPNKATKKQE